MQVYRFRAQKNSGSSLVLEEHPKPVAMAIGNFDGVHLGHQALARALVLTAKVKSLSSAVMIFEPQPMEFFRGESAPLRLMSWREKARFLAELGVQNLYLVRFDANFSHLSPQDFVKSFLMDQCQAKHILIGDDFRFGHKRAGDIHLLRQYAGVNGFEVTQAPTCKHQGARVSSTRVRAALQSSDFGLAAALLGRAFEISGKVVYGDGLGRQLGFPTANLRTDLVQLPLRGVFAVSVTESGTDKKALDYPLPAVANLGLRPTVQGKQWRCEVHVLGDHFKCLYGRRLHVRFLKKLRDEQAFPSISALKVAIEQDILAAKKVFTC